MAPKVQRELRMPQQPAEKVQRELRMPQRPAEMATEHAVAEKLSRASKVVVLTGAGISAESGIPTFRGADGFWTEGSENFQPHKLFTWEKFNEMPKELWRSYKYMANVFKKAKPNPGHYALVELEQLISCDFTLVTQNIDGLHKMAGSHERNLYQIHGNIDEIRCDDHLEGACVHGLALSNPENFAKARSTVASADRFTSDELNDPRCAMCGTRQRPNVLFFDEQYNEALFGSRSVNRVMRHFSQASDVLLIIGTQHKAGLPQKMVMSALSAGATVIKIDTLMDLSDKRLAGMLCLQAKSGEALPNIVSELTNELTKLVSKRQSCPPEEQEHGVFRPSATVLGPLELQKSAEPPWHPTAPCALGELGNKRTFPVEVQESDSVIMPKAAVPPQSLQGSTLSQQPGDEVHQKPSKKRRRAAWLDFIAEEDELDLIVTPRKALAPVKLQAFDKLAEGAPSCQGTGVLKLQAAGQMLRVDSGCKDWSNWEPMKGWSLVTVECAEDEPLGLNTDGGSNGAVYVESVRPGTWAARMQIHCLAPCTLMTVNDLDVQSLPKEVFNEVMQRRPLKLGLQRLQQVTTNTRERSMSMDTYSGKQGNVSVAAAAA